MKSHSDKSLGIQAPTFQRFMLLGLLTAVLLAGGAETAIASPMGCVLCIILGWAYGAMGAALSTLGIIIIGVGACLGKVSWGLALTVAIGISVFWGSPGILSAFTGANVTILCGAAC